MQRQTKRNKKNACRYRKENIRNKKKITRGNPTKSNTERQKEEQKDKDADEVEGKKIKRKDVNFAET